MAFLNVARWEGDPDELVALFREHVEPAAALVAETYGGVLSLHARLPDGLLTVSVYEDVERSNAMHDDPRFRAAYEKLMEHTPTMAWRGELFGARISDRAAELATHKGEPPADTA